MSAAKKKPPANGQPFNVVFAPEDWQLLERQARLEERSKAQIIRRALRSYAALGSETIEHGNDWP